VEELEQYGRVNFLRFHNVSVNQDQIQQTDETVLKICKDNLDIDLCKDDIQRSHIIGRINHLDKAQISCRFRHWQIKNQVYRAKRKLRPSNQKIVITEDLTNYRRRIINHLSGVNNIIEKITCIYIQRCCSPVS
jgi:DNA repair ATPase RecN